MAERGRPGRPRADPDEAVSPVIGTVLMLSITMLTISAVLFWGQPALERLQAGAAANTMVGEMGEVREAVLQLHGADTGRTVQVNVGEGELAIAQGTPLVVSIAYATSCEIRLTDWNDADTSDDPAPAATCFPVTAYELVGTGRVPTSGPFMLDRDYVWEARSGTGQLNAETYLFANDRVQWSRPSSSSPSAVFVEAGMAFRLLEGAHQPVASVQLRGDDPDATTTPTFALAVPSLRGNGASLPAGAHEVLLRQESGGLLTARPDAISVRVEAAGGTALAWCSSLLLRNAGDASPAWSETTGVVPGTQAAPCEEGDPDDPGGPYFAATYQPGGTFPIHLSHSVVDVQLLL